MKKKKRDMPSSTKVQKSKKVIERARKRTDFISSTAHVCIQGENEISEIKRHHTKKAFQFLFALETNK
jgi:hypothetical protein